MHDKDKGRLIRRSFAIRGYVGPNGGGKSLAMIHDILPSLDIGRPVLSTVRLIDPVTGDDHPLWLPFLDYRQLVEFEHGDVLMDEVTGIASSRESHAMPMQVVNFLVQLRRRDVTLSWTSPGWARADKVMREVTQAVTTCKGFLPVSRTEGSRMWRDRRLFVWRTFDATQFDEWTTAKRETVKHTERGIFWRPGSRAESSYDTLDAVTSLGWATESGMCMVCGGRRSVPKCTC